MAQTPDLQRNVKYSQSCKCIEECNTKKANYSFCFYCFLGFLCNDC